MTPLVSVHVVTYNQKAFLAETLDSVLAQDYSALEVVVADDGSTDGTDEIARAYAATSPQVAAITGGPNLGISGNSNRCLARCTGKYVTFLAGDDLMLPGKISAQVEWFEADSARVLCAHDMEHFDSASGRCLRLHSSITPQRSGAGVADYLKAGYFTPTSSIMVRASSMPKKGFDERIRVHSDWKFAVECLVNGGAFGCVPGVLGRYRRHEHNSTKRHANLLWEEFHVGFALLEAEYPKLISVWERARAYAYYQRAVRCVQLGDGRGARRAVAGALRHDPTVSLKLPAWWALSFLPPSALPERLRGVDPESAT